MDLHEYQAKLLMTEYDIFTPYGEVAFSPDEFRPIAEKVFAKNNSVVVKAQVHAGGRGEARGVELFQNVDNAVSFANSIFNTKLKTRQTGKDGQFVSAIYFTVGCDIKAEYYLSFVINREFRCISIIVSNNGGVNIETTASESPEKILTINIEFKTLFKKEFSEIILKHLVLSSDYLNSLHFLLENLYKMFIDFDLSMLEINPLALVKDCKTYRLSALDAKIIVDDNALWRQPKLASMRDKTQEDELERLANDVKLNYVKLEGNIGCIINGCGIAMAIMDMLFCYNETFANFLDIGGGTDRDSLRTGLNIMLRDKNAKVIIIGVFGGILSCDMVANAIIEITTEISKIQKIPPLIVRLFGENYQKAVEILKTSNLGIIIAENLDDIAKKAIQNLYLKPS